MGLSDGHSVNKRRASTEQAVGTQCPICGQRVPKYRAQIWAIHS